MDQQELQKNIALYYSKLPKEAQEAFSSMKWLETLEQMSTKYALNGNQKETLGTETTLVLLGIVDPLEYEKILTSELQLPKPSLDKMMEEIKDTILKPVLSHITKAFQQNTTLEAEKSEQVLGEHGIKIVEKADLTLPELEAGHKEEKTVVPMKPSMDKEAVMKISPMFAQKLSTPAQTPSAKTDHSLNNLSSSKIPTVDPYREIPE